MEQQWETRWGGMTVAKTRRPGIWKRKEGGYVVRGSAKNDRTGKLEEFVKALPDATTPEAAQRWLDDEKRKVRRGMRGVDAEIPTWADFAASLMQRKIETGDIQSQAGIDKWADHLEHLTASAKWSAMKVDKINHLDLATWRDALVKLTYEREHAEVRTLPRKIGRRSTEHVRTTTTHRYGPRTLNSWLAVARVVWKAAAARYDLHKDPMVGIRDFDTATARTYTREQPNALPPDLIGDYLATVRAEYPQHYAIVFLGTMLGHRPSTLRPLRRAGQEPDLRFHDDGTATLEIRRSHTGGQIVMDRTKTGLDQTILLPKAIADVLHAHVAELDASDNRKVRGSELLFPSLRHGGMLSTTALRRPVREAGKAIGLTIRLTPRMMRRTFQDVSRAANLEGVVARAISGHQTERMRQHYSTAGDAEVAGALAKVVDIASARSPGRQPGREGVATHRTPRKQAQKR